MKLITRILINTTVSLIVIISAWMIFTYHTTVSEVYEEIDEYLEKYAEGLIHRFESGVSPDSVAINFWVNSNCFMERISESYGKGNPEWTFENDEIYLDDIREEQDVRALAFNYNFPDGRWYRITVISPSFDKEDFSAILVNSSIILGGVLVLAIISIIAFIIYRRMRPMYKLLDWLRKHRVGEPADFTGGKKEMTELRLIREAVMDSVERTNEIYEQQKLFIGNASHEMQTPLAVCLNRLEELQQRSDLNEEQLADIDRVRQPLRRLNRLHRDMLQLSRIHNGAYTDCEEIKVYPLLRAMQEDFEDIFSHKEIRCLVEGNTELAVKMNPTLADLLLGNLFRNAWLHTPTGGEIRVKLSEDTVVFSNTGKDALDAERIFQRFYHSAATPQSSGLGLSICESVCRQYGFRLDYSFGDGMHHFTCCLIQS